MGRRSAVRRVLVAASVAVAAAVLVYVLARLFGDDLVVRLQGQPPRDVPLGAVVSVSAASVLAGWAVAAACTRWTRRPRPTFLAVSTLVLALSLAAPASAAEGGTVWWLGAMHVAVFLGAVPLLSAALRVRSDPRD